MDRPKVSRAYLPRVTAAWCATIVALFAVTANATPVDGIYSLTREPIAPLGSVLMLPLGARQPGDQWPSSITLTLVDGRTLDGTVAWIAPSPRPAAARRRWTDEVINFDVRRVRPGDDSRTVRSGAPYLLARLPEKAGGPILLGEQTLTPTWRDPAQSYGLTPLPGADRPALPISESPDRPEPDTPFAYWRWVLLADHLDHRPPGTDHFDPLRALLAEHYAALWRIALGRLGERSLRTAQTCRDLLTRICTDRPHRFAAWVADPNELATLLTGLLDFRKAPDALVRDAQAWTETRRGVAAWAEAGFGDSVRIAVVNRFFTPLVLRVAWEHEGGPPRNVELPPGELTRITVDRPPEPARTPLGLVDPGDRQDVLSLRTGSQVVRLAFGPRVVMARPPGAVLPAFRPALTLADLESERASVLPDTHATFAHVRRRVGRWELFVDALRPSSAAVGVAGDASEESVTITIGAMETPTAVLTIPERGSHRLSIGRDDGTLIIHRRSWADRWYCRIVLPGTWLGDDEAMLIGCRRTHGDGTSFETSPGTSAPWAQDPARVAIGLDGWDW